MLFLDPFSTLWFIQYCNKIAYQNESQRTGIYHNICWAHPLRGPQRVSDGCTVKQVTNHPKSRQKRAR
ncbi:hypothetical protein EU316_24600 [Salmonella enterica subsp. enterica serovar Braenderup]|nr:hypothetical protein [Salmonella enterica subsp. enterica serovar Braenderup]EBW5613638.1 hypothetical protein [Salmonella enterica subsp. enterica serovar Braenderup]EBX0003013.1 hypothetical protein [Salmonella enterica subsp. enterica serovar Braenderup]EBZ7909745.1 hypothetical protein [Salmonella enterica subsp. enterica serovar Braenderup]ECE7802962.1 hypothetical protein [Salmonella enterica subsp. enterica serovar Braenderup]